MMKSKAAFVERQWRYSCWFLKLFPLWIWLIAGLNIWNDPNLGNAFDWDNVIYPAGMICFTGVLYVWMRLIFKFVHRYSQHSDKKRTK